MLTNGVIVRSNQLSRAGINQQVLKNGSSVLVRIIEDKGNGKYTGSVAGVKVNISSSKAFKVGSTFVGTVNVADGKILVSPKNISTNNPQILELSILKNEQLYSLLQKLGLPQDAISLNLVQLLKQMEMKFDSGLLRKIHNLAVKFQGKEKSAAEILMILADKGLDADSEEIMQLLKLLENTDDFTGQNNQTDTKGKELLNKINTRSGCEYLVPFEMINTGTEEMIGSGIIRLLYGKDDRLKMLNLQCKYGEKKYLFSIGYSGSKCSKVKFFISNFKLENIEEKVLDLSKRFLRIDENVKVEWAEEYEIEDSACETENLYAFTGSV